MIDRMTLYILQATDSDGVAVLHVDHIFRDNEKDEALAKLRELRGTIQKTPYWVERRQYRLLMDAPEEETPEPRLLPPITGTREDQAWQVMQ